MLLALLFKDQSTLSPAAAFREQLNGTNNPLKTDVNRKVREPIDYKGLPFLYVGFQ